MTVRLWVSSLLPSSPESTAEACSSLPTIGWSDLTVVTGTDGVATLPYLPATVDPLTVRVTAPGIVPHTLPLPIVPAAIGSP